LIASYSEAVTEVPVTGTAALTDIDTPESFSEVKREIEQAADSNH
jgi:CTP:molybdopterin cytidylyltransferase MocA